MQRSHGEAYEGPRVDSVTGSREEANVEGDTCLQGKQRPSRREQDREGLTVKIIFQGSQNLDG